MNSRTHQARLGWNHFIDLLVPLLCLGEQTLHQQPLLSKLLQKLPTNTWDPYLFCLYTPLGIKFLTGNNYTQHS